MQGERAVTPDYATAIKTKAQCIHCAFVYYANHAKAKSIKHDFLPTNTIFENLNEIAATSVDERKLSH
jgi:hypothetical protein